MNPGELRKSIQGGQVQPVYLLHGDDARSIDLALKALEEAVLGQDSSPEFNADYFHGKESEPVEVISAAQTLPMMSERRLVVVRHVDEWKGAEREKLNQYMASPNPSTVLVMISTDLALRGSGAKKEDHALVSSADKAGAAVNFQRPRPKNLAELLKQMARERGKSLTDDAARLMIELAGTDTLGLEHELEKAYLFVGDEQRITREDVLEASADIKEANVFEFTDAMGSRDAETAMRALRRMREQGQEPLMIMGMLLRHFRLLWKIQEHAEEGHTPGKIAGMVGLNEWVIKKSYMPQLNKFSRADTGKITRMLADLDKKIKSTGADQDVLFEKALIKMCLGRLSP